MLSRYSRHALSDDRFDPVGVGSVACTLGLECSRILFKTFVQSTENRVGIVVSMGDSVCPVGMLV